MAKKKPAPRSKVAKKPAKKTGTTTKAQASRDAAKELGGKNARPRDIIAALAAKRITVAPAQVSAVLKAAGLRRRRRRRKVVSRLDGSRSARPALLTASDLFAVKELAIKLGGTEKLKEALAALEQLR